jgi:hypothetical protein
MSKTQKPGADGKARPETVSHLPKRDPRRFETLSLPEQKEQVRLADASMRYRMILNAADGRALVQSLPSQDLFLTIKELGRDEVPELIAMASSEQLTSFVDLDCWHKDQIDAPEALHWLALAMTEGEDKVLQAARAIDFELLTLIMRKFVRVLRGPEAFQDEDNPPDQSKCIGSYEVEIGKSRYAKLVRSMLDCLYRLDPSFYAELMETLRWEFSSCLEENAYQARCERLQDLGFPDPSQAGAIYAWVDPDTFDVEQYRRYPGIAEQEPAPGFVLSVLRARDLLAEVLAVPLDGHTGWDLTYLANKVLVADGIEFGDREQLRGAMDKVYGCLNLALEHLCHTDEAKAVRLFNETYLLPLFRLGYSLTLQLQRRAQRLLKSTVGPWLDGPWATAVEVLAKGHPFYPSILDTPPGVGGRPFRNQADVRRVGELLNTAEATRRLFEEHFPFSLPVPDDLDLEGCQPDQVQAVGLQHFFLTGLANRLLGREFNATPLPVGELASLHARVCRNKELAATLIAETQAWLRTLEPQAWPFAEACLQCWHTTLGPLLPERLDARFLDGLLVRVS